MRLDYKRLEKETGREAGRALLAGLWQQETGRPLPPISKTDRGKPFFAGESYHFSISHTPRHAFCCLHNANVGLDAEEMDRIPDPRLAGRFLSPAEQQRIASAKDPGDALLRLWVLKEAYAKYTGKGLGDFLKNTDFSPDDPRIQEIDGCYVAIITE